MINSMRMLFRKTGLFLPVITRFLNEDALDISEEICFCEPSLLGVASFPEEVAEYSDEDVFIENVYDLSYDSGATVGGDMIHKLWGNHSHYESGATIDETVQFVNDIWGKEDTFLQSVADYFANNSTVGYVFASKFFKKKI